MISRKSLSGGTASWPRAARAQQSGKVQSALARWERSELSVTTPSLQLIGHFVDPGLDASFVHQARLIGDAHVETSETHIQPATPSVVLHHEIPPVQL